MAELQEALEVHQIVSGGWLPLFLNFLALRLKLPVRAVVPHHPLAP